MRLWIVAAAVLPLAIAHADDAAPAADASVTASASAVEVSRDSFMQRWAKRDEHLKLLDVRSQEEFAAGHLPGAVNIPLDQLPARLQELKAHDQIVVYCLSGARSVQAIDFLRQQSFQHIEHLTGDFTEWQANGLPVEAGAK
jgi:rhodanese-related sulfurtransferase